MGHQCALWPILSPKRCSWFRRLFSEQLPSFLTARRPYQYGVLNGFIQLWRDAQRKPSSQQWGRAWPALVDFLERLLEQPGFWTEPIEEEGERLTPTREWIPSLIAELIEAGTKRDENAYEARLLPRTRKLLTKLLENTEAAEAPSDDPMFQAINSPRGKAIEAALINHALRECRVSDKQSSGHERSWSELNPIFEAELYKSAGVGNFEFSTLVGCYLSNLFYLSTEWVQSRVTRLFPKGASQQSVLRNFRPRLLAGYEAVIPVAIGRRHCGRCACSF